MTRPVLDQAPQRLFFALWPDDRVRAALARLASGLRLRQGRWVRPENLHVTLVFLGAVSADRRGCVEEVAAGVRAGPFDLALDQVGWWRRPQVLWAGASVTPEPLRRLVEGLREGCARCGFSPEERPFEVHATLARKVFREPPPAAIEPIFWAVGAFSLVRSSLSPAGSAYAVVRSWTLAAGDPSHAGSVG